jgi:hypothetical protein
MPQGEFFIPQPFVKQEKKPDFRNEFWREMPDMRPNRGHDRIATLKVCRYENGRHESPPKPWCPHFETEDETGFRIRPDWTVQWDKVGPDGNEVD